MIRPLAVISRMRVLNLRSMSARKTRTIASLAVVAVSSILIVAIFGTYGSMTYSVERLTNDIAGSTALEVTGVSESGFSDDLIPLIAHTAGVKVAAPMVRRPLQVNGVRALLIGVDQQIVGIQSRLGEEWREQIAGLNVDPNGVIVGPGLNLSGGDRVKVGHVDTHVSLVINGRTAADINQGHFVITDLHIAQAAVNRPARVDSVLVVVDENRSTNDVRAALENSVAGRAIVTTPVFRGSQTNTSTSFARDATLMVAAMALVVAMFVVFNTTNMTVAERRREIAITRALGAGPGAVGRDLLAEAVLVGLVGGAVGVPIGILAGHWMIGRLPPILTESFDANVRYYLPPLAAPAAVLLCVLACLAAAAVTMVAVLRISPIEAIVPAGATGLTESTSRSRWLSGIAGCAAVAGAGAMVLVLDGNGQLAGAALFLVGAIVLSYALMGHLNRLTAVIAQVIGGSAGRLAAIAITKSPGRTWITAMTVAVAVAIGITTSGTMGNLVRTTDGLFAPLGRADLYVSCTPADVTPTGPILPADLPGKVKAVPGVESVIPTQFGYATLNSRRLLVIGLANGSVSPFFDQITPQTKAKLLAGEGVLISRQLAGQFGLSTGDHFDLKTPTGPRAVTVLDEVDYLTFDAGAVVMPLDNMEQWFERPGATYYEIHYAPSADAQRVESAVRNLAPPSASVYTGAQEVQALKATIVQIGALAVGVQWVVAIVSAVALLNIFMLAVLQRRREIGVQRATGASGRLVGKAIFMEALACGLVGGLVGVAIGAVAQYVGTAGLSATTAVTVTYAFDVRTALYGVGALVLCVMGAVPPVLRAARMNIIEAVSNE